MFEGRKDSDVKLQKWQHLRICNMLLGLAKNKLLVTGKLFSWISLSEADREGREGALEEILNWQQGGQSSNQSWKIISPLWASAGSGT